MLTNLWRPCQKKDTAPWPFSLALDPLRGLHFLYARGIMPNLLLTFHFAIQETCS